MNKLLDLFSFFQEVVAWEVSLLQTHFEVFRRRIPNHPKESQKHPVSFNLGYITTNNICLKPRHDLRFDRKFGHVLGGLWSIIEVTQVKF